MCLEDCVCVLSDLAWLPFLGVVSKSWYIIIIYNTCFYKPLSWKVMYPVTSKPTPPTVSTYRHRTGFIVKRKQVRKPNYLGIPINWCFFTFFKVVHFAKKNTSISKNSLKFIIHFFFQKNIIGHTYIFNKWNDNFKFSISLKSYEE